MDYSNMSNDELLKKYNSFNNNQNKSSIDYSKKTNDELIEAYNLANKARNSQKASTDIEQISRPVQKTEQQVNLAVHGDVSNNQGSVWNDIKNSYQDNFSKFQEGYRKVGRHIPGLGNWAFGSQKEAYLIAQDNNTPLVDELEQQYNQGLINKDQFKQQLDLRTAIDNAKADRQYRDVRNKAIGKGTFELGTAVLPLGGAKIAGTAITKGAGALARNKVLAKYGAKGLQKLGTKFQERATQALTNKITNNPWFQIANHAGVGAVEGANFGALDYGVNNILGYDNENSLPENIGKMALLGTAMGSGIGGTIQGAKAIANTKFANDVANSIRNQLDAHPAVADAMVGLKNFFVPESKFQNKNDTLAKLEKLNEVKNKKPDFTNEQIAQVDNAKDISIDDFGQMHKKLTEGGDSLEAIKRELIEENSTPSKLQADIQFNNELDKLAYEFKQKPFNQFTEQEQDEFYNFIENKFNKQPKAPESNLSHVEEQGQVNTSKEDLSHVKDDSGMSNGIEKEKVGIKPKKEIKEEINNEQKFEFIPEEPNESMTGTVPQLNIQPKKERINNSFSQREKNEIKRQAKQHEKETNGFKFPEENTDNSVVAGKFQDNYRKNKTNSEYNGEVTKLESGNAEGSDTSWNTHGVQNKENYDKDYDLDYSQKQYRQAYENGTVEANTSETVKSSRFVTDNPDFIKFYDNYIKLSDIDKNAVLQTHIRKIKQTEGAEGLNKFLDDFSNQLDRDKYRSELELSDSKVSDINEFANVANAIKKENIDVNNTYTKNGKNKYASTKNKLADKINKAIETKDRNKLQSLIQKNKKLLDKADGDMAKLRDEAYHNASEFSREDMQAALDRGDFEEFEKIAKRTETIRKNDKTLFDVNEKKEWNPDTKKYESTGEVWGKEFSKIEDKYTAWEQEQKYWENKVKEAKELPKQIQEHIDRTGVDYDSAKNIVKSNNNFKTKFKNVIESIKNKTTKNEQLTDLEHSINIQYNARKNAKNILTSKQIAEKYPDLQEHIKRDGLSDEEIIFADTSKIDGLKYANGLTTQNSKSVIININNKTINQIKGIFKHETRHLSDYLLIEKHKDKKIINKLLNKYYQEIYKPNMKMYNEVFDDAQIAYNKLTDETANKLFEFDELVGNINFKEPDEFAELLSNISDVEKELLTLNDINKLTEYNNCGYIHQMHPLEHSAFDAMRDFKSEKGIVNEIREFFSKRKEYREFIGDDRFFSDGISRVGSEDRKRFSKAISATEEKTEQEPKSRLGIRKSDKGIQSAHYTPDGIYYSIDKLNKAKPLFKTEKQKQLFKDLVRYSTDDEKTLIDLGIITKGQAKNRLIKQHYKGEGVYIKTVYKPSKGKIDLEKDYNAGRNTKKGVFGEKKKYGVDREVDAQATTKQTIQRHIDIEHIKNVSKVVEENFAEPIVNGEIKKGYIGVNKNILNTMMYGKYSKDWYKTLTGGIDDIEKAFKDKEVREGWLDLFSRSSDKKLNVKYDYQIPESVFNKLVDGTGEKAAEWWNRYANNVEYGKIKGVGHWVGAINDALLNNFKKRVLTSSSFFVNNRIGNQIMIAMNSENPIDYLKSLKGSFIYKNKDVPTEIIQNSLLEAAENATIRHRYTGNNAVDNALNLFNGQLIETKNLKGMKKVGAGLANVVIGFPNKGFNKLSEKIMKFNQWVEDAERRQIFSQIVDKSRRDLIKKTGQNIIKEEEILKYINSDSEIHALVVKEIEDTLGDYKNFSPFEQKVLKRIVPFYSWYRTISRHTVKVAKEYPERVALLGMMLHNLDKKGEEAERKEYQRYGIPLKVREKRTENRLVINKGHAIPYMTFKEFWEEGGKGSVSPLVKVPLEATRGKKFFLEQEISNDRYIRKGAKWDKKEKKYTDYAYFDTKKQDYVRDKNGKIKYESEQNLNIPIINKKFNYGSLPVAPRLGYIGKELLTDTVAPYLNNSLTNGEKLLTTANNFKKAGKLKIPDRIYDASFGGYNHDDLVGFEKLKTKMKPVTRYVGNRLSPKAQAVNSIFGLSLQNEAFLNKNELEKIEQAKEEVRKRKAKFKKQ